MQSSRAPFEITTDRYTSAEFLYAEKTRVFHRAWIAIARESEIAAPGDRLTFDELDQSLFVVRGVDGKIRAFRNACRHRGMRLASGKGTGAELRCPYHGWSYDTLGQLTHVPKCDGFADLDLSTHGLRSVQADCWGGFVWLTLDPNPPPLEVYLEGLLPHLERYRLTEMRPLLRRTWTLPCNWKAVIDQASESYHLRSVHPALGRMVEAELTFEALGPHFLQVVPMPDSRLRTWWDRHSLPDNHGFSSHDLDFFHKCVVFPNTILNVMPFHLTVFRVYPLTPDTCRLHYEFHLSSRTRVLGRLRAWATLLGSLYILREDLRMLPAYQMGVNAAETQAIPFHREEQALEHFHRTLDRYVGSSD